MAATLDKVTVMQVTLPKPNQFLKRQAKHWLERVFPVVWLMTDEKRLPQPEATVSTMPRGTGVILRHSDPRKRAALAERLAPICRRRGVKLVVAGDWRLAAKVGAAGVHLGEAAARQGLAPGGRLLRRHGKRPHILTVAAHGPRGLARAVDLGATAAFLAPVFQTASHPNRTPIGVVRTTALIRAARIPVLVLGGINATSLRLLKSSGYAGIAGIGFAVRNGKN